MSWSFNHLLTNQRMRTYETAMHLLKTKTYPVIIEETNNLERGSHKASIQTWNRSDGSKPNMPEMVLFMASNVMGGTSFWIRLTSKGSISCTRLARTDFWKENKFKNILQHNQLTNDHTFISTRKLDWTLAYILNLSLILILVWRHYYKWLQRMVEFNIYL